MPLSYKKNQPELVLLPAAGSLMAFAGDCQAVHVTDLHHCPLHPLQVLRLHAIVIRKQQVPVPPPTAGSLMMS